MGLFSNIFGRKSVDSSINAENTEKPYKNQILATPDNSYDFLDSFNRENWSNSSYQDRMNAYQSLEHCMAKEQGRAERQVVFEDFSKTHPDAVGYYSKNDDKLHMDIGYLNGSKNPYDGMDTVIHEGRHAYQHDCINGFAQPDSKLQPNMQGIKENDLDDNYYSGGGNYFYQPLEYDAHTYANNVMNRPEFKEHLSNDEHYNKYCRAQEKYIDAKSRDAEIAAGYTYDNLSNNVKNAEDHRNMVLSNPNSSQQIIDNANNNLSNSKSELNRFVNDNYTDGKFDIEKAGNSLSHNDALNKGYSEEELRSIQGHPTPAQTNTQRYNGIYDSNIEPHCADFDMANHLDEHPGAVDDAVYGKTPESERNQDYFSNQNGNAFDNALTNYEAENSSNGNDVQYVDENVDDYHPETVKGYGYGSHNVYSELDNPNGEFYAKQENGTNLSESESQENPQENQQEAGVEPNQDENQENSQDAQQEVDAEPNQDESQENSQDAQQEVDAEPNQDESQENPQENQQEAGVEPNQDENQENSQDAQEEVDAEPNQDESQENSQENQQEAGVEPNQDESQENPQENQQEAGTEPNQDESQEKPQENQQEVDAEPNQDENQEKPQENQQEAGTEPSQDESQEKPQGNQQEAGTEPSQDESQENSQENQQEAGTEPNQDESQEKPQGNQQETGTEPNQDESQENPQENQQEADAGCEQSNSDGMSM